MRAGMQRVSQTSANPPGSAGQLSFVSVAAGTKAEGLDDTSAGSEGRQGVKKIKDLYRIDGIFL